MPPAVQAWNARLKKMVPMKDPKPLYSVSANGAKHYRLQGKAADGTVMSAFVSEAVALKYGTPKKVAVKAKATKKTCKEKYDECLVKHPGRGKKVADLETAVEIVADAASDVVASAKKVGKVAKTKKAKAAVKKVEEAASELVDAAEVIGDAVAEEAPKKRGRKPGSTKKAPAKKTVAKKPGRKPVAKKTVAKKPVAKKAPKKKVAKKTK